MPRLGDVIDALVRDLYTARALNDAHAAEIFELYKQSDTMRKLAMPVFRIGKMDISLPLRAVAVESEDGDAPSSQPIATAQSIDRATVAIGSLYQSVTSRSLTPARTQELTAALTRTLRQLDEPHSREALIAEWSPVVVRLFRKWRISTKLAGIKDIESRLSAALAPESSPSASETRAKAMQVEFVKSNDDASVEGLVTLNFEIREQVARWQLVTGEEEGHFEQVLVVE